MKRYCTINIAAAVGFIALGIVSRSSSQTTSDSPITGFCCKMESCARSCTKPEATPDDPDPEWYEIQSDLLISTCDSSTNPADDGLICTETSSTTPCGFEVAYDSEDDCRQHTSGGPRVPHNVVTCSPGSPDCAPL